MRKPGKDAKEEVFEYVPFHLSAIAAKPAESAGAPSDAQETGDSPGAEEAAEIEAAENEAAAEGGEAPSEKVREGAEALLMACKNDDWQLKGLARATVRAKSAASPFDKEAFDKAVNSEKARFKRRMDKGEIDPLLAKRAQVRIVAMLEDVAVKTQKARSDGAPPRKWAVLTLDDGSARAEVQCFSNAWEKYGTALESAKGGLVAVFGELSARAEYSKQDVAKEHPSPGRVSLSVTEVYPCEAAMPSLSGALKIMLGHADPELEEKLSAVVAAARRHPGRLPLSPQVEMEDGSIVDFDMGPACRVACGMAFLSELLKSIRQNDIDFAPSGAMSLESPEE
ncbi:MAG: hypothetical protein IIT98_02400 [Kiritimatiellae bacterium]|nr:hypothetical protein [Kiritimatiellia bacterium]